MTFCAAPFVHMTQNPDGQYRTCCMYEKPLAGKYKTIKEYGEEWSDILTTVFEDSGESWSKQVYTESGEKVHQIPNGYAIDYYYSHGISCQYSTFPQIYITFFYLYQTQQSFLYLN